MSNEKRKLPKRSDGSAYTSNKPIEKESFTPGPWKVSQYWKLSENSSNGEMVYLIHMKVEGYRSKKEIIANGNLIEAAPDMYYALKKAIVLLEPGEDTYEIVLSALSKANPQ